MFKDTNKLQIEYLRTDGLKSFERQLRKPSRKLLEKTVRHLEEVGFVVPLAVDKNGYVVVGEHFFAAAQYMKMEEVPAVRLDHLRDDQVRILRMAYTRLMEEEKWIQPALAAEFKELQIAYPDLDLTLTAFEVAEIDTIFELDAAGAPEEEALPPAGPAVSRLGDLWQLGEHHLYCGDSRDPAAYQVLMGEEKARMTFADPPYNVAIDLNVCGFGSIKHAEFAMGSGEMTEEQFTAFLKTALERMTDVSVDGAIHFVCMDFRHLYELQTAARQNALEFKNLCVWVKDNGGMGSFYRSRHELVLVFKQGRASHVNNIAFGKYGRYRTNVWEYAGMNTMRAGRQEELAMHPTVKPTDLVADAIKDCSRRGDIILDPFGGSGTTLIAAEKTGRKARLIEIAPNYCDVILRRWQKLTGHKATLVVTGEPFEAVTQKRAEKEGKHG